MHKRSNGMACFRADESPRERYMEAKWMLPEWGVRACASARQLHVTVPRNWDNALASMQNRDRACLRKLRGSHYWICYRVEWSAARQARSPFYTLRVDGRLPATLRHQVQRVLMLRHCKRALSRAFASRADSARRLLPLAPDHAQSWVSVGTGRGLAMTRRCCVIKLKSLRLPCWAFWKWRSTAF
jgi:hypothetical protein